MESTLLLVNWLYSGGYRELMGEKLHGHGLFLNVLSGNCWVAECIGWVQTEYSALSMFWCCNLIPGGRITYEEKRQLYTIVLEAQEPANRSQFNSGGYLDVDGITVALAYRKEHSHGMTGRQNTESCLIVAEPSWDNWWGWWFQCPFINLHSSGWPHFLTSLHWRLVIQHPTPAVSQANQRHSESKTQASKTLKIPNHLSTCVITHVEKSVLLLTLCVTLSICTKIILRPR